MNKLQARRCSLTMNRIVSLFVLSGLLLPFVVPVPTASAQTAGPSAYAGPGARARREAQRVDRHCPRRARPRRGEIVGRPEARISLSSMARRSTSGRSRASFPALEGALTPAPRRRQPATGSWPSRVCRSISVSTRWKTQSECASAADPFGSLRDLPFGRENNYRFGLSVSQTLFSGGRVRGQTQAAGAEVRSAAIGLTSARAQLLLDVTGAYYDASLADRLLTIAQATLDQADTTLSQTQLAREVGNLSEFDLLRARVTRDNQRPIVIQRRADRDLAYSGSSRCSTFPWMSRWSSPPSWAIRPWPIRLGCKRWSRRRGTQARRAGRRSARLRRRSRRSSVFCGSPGASACLK